jgi:hypothetical protein
VVRGKDRKSTLAIKRPDKAAGTRLHSNIDRLHLGHLRPELKCYDVCIACAYNCLKSTLTAKF